MISLQRRPSTKEETVRGHNATLLLESVSYDDQGQYICVATNIIKNQERSDQSSIIDLEVVGKYQYIHIFYYK